ncbi:GFA family protein [Bradyrhizobium sp. S69]|uniref:GFA family protein n=1 Tax=Bradyrhizobium sp. S69 TaxID=1641856 RepID=UPI00131E0E9D|nr:GFA family protein [Bradyrhizobium sp. S69]
MSLRSSGLRGQPVTKTATPVGVSKGQCLCGKVGFEIDTPARWAWHDHSAASRRAHGAAYATYVGSWRKRFRITKGQTNISRYQDKATSTTRSFCTHCGSPLFYERPRSPHMVNIPRALLTGRTGRQPLYHIAIEELQEWAYTGEPLGPLKGFPGVVWQRSKKKKPIEHEGMF